MIKSFRTLEAHCPVNMEQWAEGEHVQDVIWDVFRFEWAGLLMNEGVHQTSTRRESIITDLVTGAITLTIEAEVEPRT